MDVCMAGEIGIMKDKSREKNKKSAEKKKSDKKQKNEMKSRKLAKNSVSLKAAKKKKHKKNLKENLKEEIKASKKPLSPAEEIRETDELTASGKEPVSRQDAKDRNAVGIGDRSQEKSRQDRALIYRALGDESRLQILDILREQEMCAADLLKLVPIVQSTLSHHMKILCESGLVQCRKQARWSYYSVNKQLFGETADRLKKWSE